MYTDRFRSIAAYGGCLLLALAALPAAAVTRTAAPPALASLAEGGFETPNLASADWTQSVSGSSWAFSSGGGIAANGSVWLNAPAPEGDQVAIVQNGAVISKNITPSVAGHYRLTLMAAQRPTNNHTFMVRVGGVEVLRVNPASTNWSRHESKAFDLTTNSTSIEILGIGTATDNTAFVDDLRFELASYADDPGFENAQFTGYGYNPTSLVWTFSAGAGVHTAPGPWAVGIAAPEGQQVAFLQGPGASVDQTVAVPAGRYNLSFYAAQRAGNNQEISVRIDGNEVGRARPSGSSFQRFRFDALKLGAGSHQLQFYTLDNGDQTVLLDHVQLLPVASLTRRWSDPAAWIGGTPPGSTDHVDIPLGSGIVLDGSRVVGSMDIGGELYCDDAAIALDAGYVTVMGQLVCGSPSAPFLHNFVLTLHGAGGEFGCMDMGGVQHCMGDKFLGAKGSGVIELHGEKRTAWTQLRASAKAGDQLLRLDGSANWRSGDSLVIAPTRWTSDALGQPINESEVVTVTSVAAAEPGTGTGIDVGIAAPLVYAHYGQTSTYSKPDNSYSWTLDERAEVGLLSRNIAIRGNAASSTSKFGGHMMSMPGTTVHVSGIELQRMGQLGLLARYPFHWHLVGNAPGQYIVNSSVHESYNRCITVHGTHDTLVADNVCYDFIGHGYFLEDGIEKNNTFDHNLAIWGRRPAKPNPQQQPPPPLPLETDYRDELASSGPAAFWISNPENIYTNNAAAGVQGSAFWYHLATSVQAPSASLPGGGINPRTAQFGVFDNNRAHTGRQGFSSCFFGSSGVGMESPGTLISRLTTNNLLQALWPCSDTFAEFDRSIVANSENGLTAPAPLAFNDSIFIGHSANAGPRADATAYIPWGAIGMYDQGFVFDNVHFANYDRPAMSVFQVIGGAHRYPNNRMSRTSFSNAPNVFRDITDAWRLGVSPVVWGEVIHDLDGSFMGLGAGGTLRAMVSNHPLMTNASCRRDLGSGIDGFACPYRYATFRLDAELTPSELVQSIAPRVTVVRSDGVHDTSAHEPFRMRFMQQFMSNGPYRYGYRYEEGIRHEGLDAQLYWAHPYDTSVHEIMDVPATVRVLNAGWTPQTTLDNLIAAPTSSYFYNAGSSSLFLKMVAAGNTNWTASAVAELCMSGLPDSPCPAATRTVAAPTVRITSPLDGARIAVDGSVTVTADIGGPGSIVSARLYIGDTFKTESQVPPYTTTSGALAAGSYPLKLVVKNSLGQSFTAIQQLHVGDAATHIDFVTPVADESTYFATGLPANLPFTVTSSAGRGEHVHLLKNGIDQGDYSASSISLAGLPQGRHTFEVLLASAQHALIPVRAKHTVHVVQNGVLADFEDGIDTRGRLTVHHPAPDGDTLTTVGSAWTPARLSRLAPQINDINYFDLPSWPNQGAAPIATYDLSLLPGLSWAGYSQIELHHGGPGFQLLLRYADLSQPYPVGYAAATPGIPAVFTLPNRPGALITGVQLRYYADAAGHRDHFYGIRLLP